MEADRILPGVHVVEPARYRFVFVGVEMNAVFTMVHIVSNVVVVLFVGVSVLLLGAGLFRRFRFKKVLLSWGNGRFFGLPLAPTLLLGGILVLMAFSLGTGEGLFATNWVAATAYVLGGLFWYLGALFSGATLVTEWGIGIRSGRRDLRIMWREITDYAVTVRGRSIKYVFFKVDRRGYKRRIELSVPIALKERFEAIVELRLDKRFDRSIHRPKGQRALER